MKVREEALCKIRFALGEQTAETRASPGVTVLEAGRRAGLHIESPCGGLGLCGKCACLVNGSPALACTHRVSEDAFVVFRAAHGNEGAQNPISGQNAALPGSGKGAHGLAVDIGTTTLAAALVNLDTGKKAATETRLNPQTEYGQDVLSRINFAASVEGRQTLRRVLLEALRDMTGSLCEKSSIRRENIYEAVFSGNPTMIYLAAGFDPAPLGRAPFKMDVKGGVYIPAKDFWDSAFAEGAKIWLSPMVSAFVGSDIVSGILAVGLENKRGTTLFIDIGTNGEMVLAHNGKLAASATAAGPAFEGMNITCGTRAREGAIDSFRVLDGECLFTVIGAGEAAKSDGICGSGLLDIVGELVRTGAVLPSGRFADWETLPPCLASRLRRHERFGNAFFLSEEVFLTQKDIRQVQLAKAAIRSGGELLLARFGLSADSLDEVIIAGSFGEHLCEESLLNIGLLPACVRGKVRFAGNTSLAGSVMFLLNRSFRMTRLAERVEAIDLSSGKDFQDTFVRFLGF